MDNYNKIDCENSNMKFVWGVKSYDDICLDEANIHTLNDIEILYDCNTNLYLLSIETAYRFQTIKYAYQYFKQLLDNFTKYMEENNYSTETQSLMPLGYLFDKKYNFEITACTIEQLYANFKDIIMKFCFVCDITNIE